MNPDEHVEAPLACDISSISEPLRRDMEKKSIDVGLTCAILNDYNAGLYDDVKQVAASGVPSIDGKVVVDTRCRHDASAVVYAMDEDEARANLARFGLSLPETTLCAPGDSDSSAASKSRAASRGRGKRRALFTAQALETIGAALLPLTAYGVLNGGSATSYADSKKNLALGQDVFAALSAAFDEMAPLCKNQPKGLTPAYINPDGTAGASFLELKMRARLVRFAKLRDSASSTNIGREGQHMSLQASRAIAAHDGTVSSSAAAPLRGNAEFMPLFQMTSSGNDEQLTAAYEAMRSGRLLGPLSARLGLASSEWHTGVQSMIAAFTHSSEGRPRRIFDRAYGMENAAIALPGGHGQCFRILAPVFRDFYERGIRFAYIGNVDNIAYTPDPLEVAILALSGKPAGFEFSVRTPMDVKGGILVRTGDGACTIADIGPAIAFDEVLRLEKAGYSILFNCAVGLFDLSYLVPHLEEIARRLPVRFTDQDKDAGRYSQAEQVTWEVLSCLPAFLAFAVDKNERFLAAKLLVDTLLTSGVAVDDPNLPTAFRTTAQGLNKGLTRLLGDTYGLVLSNGKWIPAESVGQG